MSKSKPQTTSAVTDTSQHIPDWLDNAGKEAVTRATTLSNKDYAPYKGEMVAPQSADTLGSYQAVRDAQGQGAPAFGQSLDAYGRLVGSAAPITAGGVNDNTNALYGNFNQNVMNPAQGLLGSYLNGGPATAAQVGQNAQTLMSPYAQNVIDPTLAAGEQAREIARQKIAGNAANAGAFGGSRQGVAEGVSDAQTLLGTQQQIGQMLNTGWGQALNSGTQLGLQAGQQGYGAATGLANMGAQGYANAAQAGQGIANTNLNAGLSAAAGLPGVAGQQQTYDYKDAAALQASGGAQQNYQQQLDNAKYGQYYDQQNYPVQNLDLLLGAVGGIPYSTNGMGYSTQTQMLNKNVAGGVIGGGLAGATAGATLGSVFPGIGTAVGAVGGGLLGALGGAL
jgi:hypothetical protein